MPHPVVLITTANGMFGGALVRELAGDARIQVRAMVRDRSKFTAHAPNVEAVTGDLDIPDSLVEPLTGVTHVFLTSPMDAHIAARETAVTAAAARTGTAHVLKLHGAVDHAGDPLARQHEQSIAALRSSGLPWTLISPSSVLETSLLPYAQLIAWNALVGISGTGRVGFVALTDVARVAAEVIRSAGYVGQNLLITGPAAVTLKQVADDLGAVIGRTVHYYDLPEEDFAQMLLTEGGYPSRDVLETTVLCHMRAWRDGRAELVADTVQTVTGQTPQSVRDWIAHHRDPFDPLPRHLTSTIEA
jgi:NAD(P)H dehydrogenase (quinone)